MSLLEAYQSGGGPKNHEYCFKPKDPAILPRVRDVCGFLESVWPESVVDFGSQRGALLFPMMERFPHTHFTAVDRDPKYLAFLRCLERGLHGTEPPDRLRVLDADVTGRVPLPDKSIDVVVLSEILEHLEHPALAVSEAYRLAARAIVATVPSKPDDNPEHIQLFSKSDLEKLFEGGKVRAIKSGWLVCVLLDN